MRHIKRSALSQVQTVLPPSELRHRMATVLEPIDGLSLDLVRATRTLRASRNLLLPRLVSGDIDVENLNVEIPDDAAEKISTVKDATDYIDQHQG